MTIISATQQQAVQTNCQQLSPSCSTIAITEKPITLRKMLDNFLERKRKRTDHHHKENKTNKQKQNKQKQNKQTKTKTKMTREKERLINYKLTCLTLKGNVIVCWYAFINTNCLNQRARGLNRTEENS